MSLLSIISGVTIVYCIYYIGLISYDLFLHQKLTNSPHEEEEDIIIDENDTSIAVASYENYEEASSEYMNSFSESDDEKKKMI